MSLSSVIEEAFYVTGVIETLRFEDWFEELIAEDEQISVITPGEALALNIYLRGR